MRSPAARPSLRPAVTVSNPSYSKGAKPPVEQVSWDDCQEHIRKPITRHLASPTLSLNRYQRAL